MEKDFISWGDHESLLAYYNDLTKLGTVRLNKHRQLIQDLKFTDKYLAGKKNPTDYASRHPHGIEHLTQEQRERLQEWMRILVNDLPKALMVDLMKKAATGQEISSSGV